MNRFLSVAAALLFTLGASSASAVTFMSFGAGSAVSTADRSMNFNSITQGSSLSSIIENDLEMMYSGLANCQTDKCGNYPGFSSFDGSGFVYSSAQVSPVTLATTDGADLSALEVRIGTGWGSLNLYWETYKDSVLVGNGSFTGLRTENRIFGFSDAMGFDEIRLNTFFRSGDTSGQNQIAIDDVSAQLFNTPPAVPLPAGVLLFGTALAGFGVMRRRQRQRF